MNRETFLTKFKTASSELDYARLKNVIADSISPATAEKMRGQTNLVIIMEKFAECAQEVAKFLRGKSDRLGLLEETADAFLSIYYIQECCGITPDELVKAINVKLDRQEARNIENNRPKGENCPYCDPDSGACLTNEDCANRINEIWACSIFTEPKE